jgi:hypothetical protein
LGKEVVVMFTAESTMLIESAAVSDAEAASLALTVKPLFPSAFGAPVICPDEVRFNPAGSVPELIDHV